MHIIGWIIVGALAGWIASKIVNKKGEGCLVNMALGLVGALIGGWLFGRLGGEPYEMQGFVMSTLVAVIGAVIALLIWNAITGRNSLRN